MNTMDMHEDFLNFESKVNQVMKLLEDMSNANKTDSEAAPVKKAEPKATDVITEDDFIVSVRHDRTAINRKVAKLEAEAHNEMDKFTFMQQMEEDANKRAKVRQERERIAQNFRDLGNEAFRKANYEKAILMYTKAIEHIKDSPILYNNRALSYIKIKNFKRAIIDCDYILNNLEEKNLRAWLYRAAAYRRLGDDKNCETSIKLAKKNNTKAGDYIEKFVEKMREI